MGCFIGELGEKKKRIGVKSTGTVMRAGNEKKGQKGQQQKNKAEE